MQKALISDAKNNFSSFIELAERGERVELTRDNINPVALIISYEEYKAMKPQINWFDKFREKHTDSLLEDGLPYTRMQENPNIEKYAI